MSSLVCLGHKKVTSFFLIHLFDIRLKYFLPNFILSIKSDNTGLDLQLLLFLRI